jgi:hypothetical protein
MKEKMTTFVFGFLKNNIHLARTIIKIPREHYNNTWHSHILKEREIDEALGLHLKETWQEIMNKMVAIVFVPAGVVRELQHFSCMGCLRPNIWLKNKNINEKRMKHGILWWLAINKNLTM